MTPNFPIGPTRIDVGLCKQNVIINYSYDYKNNNNNNELNKQNKNNNNISVLIVTRIITTKKEE